LNDNRFFKNWNRTLLISLQLPYRSNSEVQRSLIELSSLVYSFGGKVTGHIIQARTQIHPANFFGKGKLKDIRSRIKIDEIDTVLVDNQLTPKQTQNLEKFLECEVFDRTKLILDIFANNARTSEAKLQIALAQSEYLLPRLVGFWKHLDRERGGIGASRGTGEKQIEKDRQFLRQRISRYKNQLVRLEKERNTQKQRRSNCLKVSLIGYTNAGKSTIMNALTNSSLLVENRLFATLDSTTRILEKDSRPKVLLSDTVGFINNLPHEVIAAFRSTLATVRDADLLIQVIDCGDHIEEHLQTTSEVLKDLESSCIPIIKVFNKIDKISHTRLLILEKLYPEAVFGSCVNGEKNGLEKRTAFVEQLRKQILLFFNERMKTVKIRLDYKNSQKLANIYKWSRVNNIDYQKEGILMTLTAIPENLERLRHHLGSDFAEMI